MSRLLLFGSGSSSGGRPRMSEPPMSLNATVAGNESENGPEEMGMEVPEVGGEETVSLPNMADLGMDFTDSNNF